MKWIKSLSPRVPYWTRGTLWAKNHEAGMQYVTVSTDKFRYAICVSKQYGTDKFRAAAYRDTGKLRCVASTPHGGETDTALEAARNIAAALEVKE